MNSDLIDKSYTHEYNSIYKACREADEDDELTIPRCYVQARALLAEPTIPLHHRIKILLLLVGIVDDLDEASAFLRRAEIQWIVAQKENGHVPAAEESLIELDTTIKELRAVLAKEEADNNADDADDADDAGDAKKGSLEDEGMEPDHDHPATVASHLSKRLTALKINDSKQDTAVKVAKSRSP